MVKKIPESSTDEVINQEEKVTKTSKTNYWMVVSVVLGVLLVFSALSGGITGNAVGTSNVVTAEEAGEMLKTFASGQGSEITIIETTDDGSFYNIKIDIQGQQADVKVTKDGEFLATLIPLNVDAAAPTENTQQAQAPANTPKSDIPDVDLYVMSICPFGTQAEKGLLEALDVLGDKVDFELKFVSYAMHDIDEINENTAQYCVQKEYPEKLKEYLYCYLQEQDPKVWNSCIGTLGMDKARIDSCIEATDKEFGITAAYEDKSTWLSGRYPIYPIHLADNQQYGVGGSPTLIINGAQVQSARDPNSYLSTLCSAFNVAPEECNTELSTTAFSPGFGFATSPTSASAAACGAY